MDINNIVNILLFILPGMLVERIYDNICFSSKKGKSNFREVVNGVLLSLPIILFSGVVFSFFYKITTLEIFLSSLSSFPGLLIFIGIVFLFSFIIGIFSDKLIDSITALFNWMRKKRNRMSTSNKTCWQNFLLEKNESKYLEVIQNGESYKGFALHYSLENEDKALVLENPTGLYEFDDYKPDELFINVVGIYIDIEKNIVIKDYDMREYNEWCDKKESSITP